MAIVDTIAWKGTEDAYKMTYGIWLLAEKQVQLRRVLQHLDELHVPPHLLFLPYYFDLYQADLPVYQAQQWLDVYVAMLKMGRGT
eukprot:gene16617-10501_t